MSRPKNVALQEQILAEAQKKLERIEKMRAEMAKQVELEMKRLEDMREIQEDFTQSGGTTPSLGDANPVSFRSIGGSSDKLNTIGNDGIDLGIKLPDKLQTPQEKAQNGVSGVIDFTGKLITPSSDTPHYRASDRSEHWTNLVENPGKPVYVSGRYVSSEHGNHSIVESNEYEYELSVRALPVSVGDILRAPVHPTGHGDGKAYTTGHLQYMVTDIYSTPKFHRYHDRIEG